jgi:hypothetical protein
MASSTGPDSITDGLVLSLDSRDTKSNPRTGTTWYDRSGTGAHFTIPSGINTGNSIDLSDTTSTRGAATAWQVTNEMTIDTWFYAADGGTHSGCCDTLFGRYDFRFFIINSSLYTMISFNNSGNRYYQHPNISISYDAWHHAVGMRRDDKFIIWVDGVERHNSSFGTGLDLYNVGDTYRLAQSRHSDLQIAKSRIWNRGLSDAEIKQLYNNDKSHFGG